MADLWTAVAETFADAGAAAVFGLPRDERGLLDAAAVLGRPRAFAVRDQRSGACQAIGYAQAAGRPVVIELSSGPAFLNALVGVSEAASVGAPIVVVTTRTPNEGIARGGFQELDQLGVAGPVVGWSYRVERADRLAWAVRRATALAARCRPSVSLLEITDELAGADIPPSPRDPGPPPGCVPFDDDLDRAVRLMRGARRPLIVAGGGARSAGRELERLAEVWDAALATTASGRGGVDENHPLSCGLVGLYATPPLDEVLNDADVVLAVGTRWEETATMDWPGLAGASVVHVDRDVTAFDRSVPADVALLGDAAATVRALLARMPEPEPLADPQGGRAWRETVAVAREKARQNCEVDFQSSPTGAALRRVAERLGESFVLAQDNGLHDIWGYHFPLVRIGPASTAITPGEQTMMGFGLGAAVGAALAEPERPVLATCGDGAFSMGLPALFTAAEHGCRLVVLVFDDEGFGWPRAVRRHEGGEQSLTRFPTPLPVVELARAHGALARTVRSAAELDAYLDEALPLVRAGTAAVVHVPTFDTDVPPGVERHFAEARRNGDAN
ncbi:MULTISPECIES: thiamine pyrophosphate-binding protein [Actinomadura]|uniref:Thiamine pyrophosphate-binding protein n=2 Tax=Actinomadura yumaensis TaxID=111807 RepID=A0ABW2CJW7_9ACTN|nr:thiamine pyrophosphate-dependent enzyme [Actinomadura sp. J1-007]MWK40036.1 thiamine pyrophosphate-binding protein [Actinomadura sp. J1-007]